MDSEEQGFDFMAAAEDTGKRLDELVEAIPREIRQTLANEYRKSPWVSALQEIARDMSATVKHAESAAGKANAAAENIGKAGDALLKKIRLASVAACIGAMIIPLATWGIAYWNVSGLRHERLRLEWEEKEIDTAIELKRSAGREEISRREKEIEKLSATAKALQKGIGGGIELTDKGDGAWTIALPAHVKLERPWKESDGRYVIPYVVSGK